MKPHSPGSGNRRRALPRWLLLTAGLAGAVTAGAFTYETPDELNFGADFDADGRTDVAIVDRVTGSYRIGYQTAPGTYKWAEARSSGVQNVTAATSGKILDLSKRQVLVTGPDANRVNTLNVDTPTTDQPPFTAFTTGIGPAEVVALNIPGGGDTAHDDLLVVDTKLTPPNSSGMESIRNNAGAFSPIGFGPLAAPLRQMRLVTLTTPGTELIGALQVGGSSDSFRVWTVGGNPAVPTVSVNVPKEHHYVFGRFNNHDRHHFLFFQRGKSDFQSVPVNAGPALGAAVSFDLTLPIEQLIPLATTTNRLFAVLDGGSRAKVYQFDGNTAPQELQDIPAPAGESLTGIVPAPDGSFLLFSGQPGVGASRNFHRYTPNGLKFDKVASGALPAVNAFGTTANVFLFAGEPFVAAKPVLVRTLNAADWSSKPNLGGANVLVQSERLGTSAAGLDNPAVRDLGAKPASVSHALVNQYAPPISVASFRPASGDEVVDFAITPPPGPQQGAITVFLSALNQPATVFWRTAPSQPWSSSANLATIPLFQNSTVEFFGQVGSRKSRIRTAAFSFPEAPATQDSDGDGVPDFVELAKGLNPNGGSDSDGDGYTDKDELLAGTNPLDVNLPPTNAPIAKLQENAAFNLVAAPRPYDGFTPGEVGAKGGQGVHLHTLTGGFLGTEETKNVAGAPLNPAAEFLDAPADTTRRLLSLATDSHLDIQSAGPSTAVGREVLGLVPVPELAPPTVSFTPGPGPLSGQADAWIDAAKASLSNLLKPTINARFGVNETVAALLLERKLEQILASRGHSFPPTNRLTLFSFRPNDVIRQELTDPQLEELQALGPVGQPAWNPVSMHDVIGVRVQSAFAAELRLLANDLYRISSLSNNAAPGQYPLPVDALRSFFDTGKLHSNYLAASTLSPAQLSSASNQINGILIGLTPRPTNSFDLEVTAASFQDRCTTLKLVGSADTRNLFVAPGVPFKFPDSFMLLPGSRVRVLAFTDFTDPCPGVDLQVISAQLIAIPAPTLADTDGDFMPDDWECLFLGSINDDALGDKDNDGVTNLQEYLDGTDAADKNSKPAVVVNLAPPVLNLEPMGGGQLKLTFQFPANYIGYFQFLVQTSSDIGGGFGEEILNPVHLGGGQFELNLLGDGSVKFFLLQQLKPLVPSPAQLARQPLRR